MSIFLKTALNTVMLTNTSINSVRSAIYLEADEAKDGNRSSYAELWQVVIGEATIYINVSKDKAIILKKVMTNDS